MRIKGSGFQSPFNRLAQQMPFISPNYGRGAVGYKTGKQLPKTNGIILLNDL
jgi:hypothetical protein